MPAGHCNRKAARPNVRELDVIGSTELIEQRKTVTVALHLKLGCYSEEQSLLEHTLKRSPGMNVGIDEPGQQCSFVPVDLFGFDSYRRPRYHSLAVEQPDIVHKIPRSHRHHAPHCRCLHFRVVSCTIPDLATIFAVTEISILETCVDSHRCARRLAKVKFDAGF